MENTVYIKNGDEDICLREALEVTEINDNRVRYREIYGWDYGFPKFGMNRSTTVKNIEENYTKMDWTQL